MRFAAIACLLAAACSKGPSEEQCKTLLDHLVDLEFKKAGAGATTEAMKSELAKQKQAVTDAKTEEFVQTCEKKTSKDRVDCALQASDIDGVAKCDESK